LLCFCSVTVAQDRSVTYTSCPGELYLIGGWYGIYSPIYPWAYDTLQTAIYRITENGKKLTIQYDIDAFANPADTVVPYSILADATPGVVYVKTYYSKNSYFHTSLWTSFDYGKNWLHREENIGKKSYCGTCAVEGIIYRGEIDRSLWISKNHGNSFEFDFIIPLPYNSGITAYKECEFYALGKISQQYEIHYTDNCANSFTVIPIDSQFMFGNYSRPPDVYRGGLPGEVYVSSMFPEGSSKASYKVSFSADTGHTFRHVYVSDVFFIYDNSQPIFMSDREPGVFYILKAEQVEDFNPAGHHTKVCIEYYRDYGETLVATYCHDLHKNYGKTCEAVNDLVSEKCGNSCVLLTWSEPESSLPVEEYWVYRIAERRTQNAECRKQNAEGRKQKAESRKQNGGG